MVECKEGHYCSSQSLADVSGEWEAGSYSYHLIWASRVLWILLYLGMWHFIIENFWFFTINDDTSSTKKETKNVEIRPFSN